MTLDQAQKFVAMRDAQTSVERIHQAMQDTCNLFDKRDPEGSNRRIAATRAQLARELAAAALEYAALLDQYVTFVM
jgi:hypothetical protein